MKLNKRQLVELILLIIAVVSWLLRKLDILYIPGLTGIVLGVAMGMLGVGFIAQKDKAKKVAGVLVLAFGLFNIFIALVVEMRLMG